MSGDTFVISGLKEKRSAVAGRMVDIRRELDRLQGDLAALDSVLRPYDVEPSARYRLRAGCPSGAPISGAMRLPAVAGT